MLCSHRLDEVNRVLTWELPENISDMNAQYYSEEKRPKHIDNVLESAFNQGFNVWSVEYPPGITSEKDVILHQYKGE